MAVGYRVSGVGKNSCQWVRVGGNSDSRRSTLCAAVEVFSKGSRAGARSYRLLTADNPYSRLLRFRRYTTGVTPLGLFDVGVSAFLHRFHPSGVEDDIYCRPNVFLQRCHPSGVRFWRYWLLIYIDTTPLGLKNFDNVRILFD